MTTSTRLCFVDVETTSLRPDRRAWEIGIIERGPDADDAEHHFFIDSDDLDLGNADLSSLKIGRFFERHPQARVDDGQDDREFENESYALLQVEVLTRGAIIVGVNPGFDTETLGARMRAHGICPSWNYRIVDARTFAAGALKMALPWDVDAIYESFGVSCPEDKRHTALGDAALARDLYDAVMQGGK